MNSPILLGPSPGILGTRIYQAAVREQEHKSIVSRQTLYAALNGRGKYAEVSS